MGVDGERRQRLAGGLWIVERERGGAVRADDLGEQVGVADQSIPRARVVVDDEHRRDQHQRQPAGADRQDCQFARQRTVPGTSVW